MTVWALHGLVSREMNPIKALLEHLLYTRSAEVSEREVVFLGNAARDASLMWKLQPLGPYSPHVVTEDHELHHICRLLAVFGGTDVRLIPRRSQTSKV